MTISLAADNYDRLNVLAEKDEVSISWVVRRAIEEYLQNHAQPAARVHSNRSVHKREDARSSRR